VESFDGATEMAGRAVEVQTTTKLTTSKGIVMDSKLFIRRAACSAGVALVGALTMGGFASLAAHAATPGSGVSGSAVAAEVNAPGIGLLDYTVVGASDTGATTGTEQNSAASAPANAEFSAGLLNAGVTVTANTTSASASLASFSLAVPGDAIVASGISSQASDAAQSAPAGDATIAQLKIGSTVYNGDQPPNTVESLDSSGDKVIINEQIPGPAGTDSLTVNALEIELPTLGLDIQVASVGVNSRQEPDQSCDPNCGGLLSTIGGSTPPVGPVTVVPPVNNPVTNPVLPIISSIGTGSGKPPCFAYGQANGSTTGTSSGNGQAGNCS